MIHAYEIEHMIRSLQESMVLLQCERSYETEHGHESILDFDTHTRRDIKGRIGVTVEDYIRIQEVAYPSPRRGANITTLRGSLLILRDADILKRILDRIHQDRSDRKRGLS